MENILKCPLNMSDLLGSFPQLSHPPSLNLHGLHWNPDDMCFSSDLLHFMSDASNIRGDLSPGPSLTTSCPGPGFLSLTQGPVLLPAVSHPSSPKSIAGSSNPVSFLSSSSYLTPLTVLPFPVHSTLWNQGSFRVRGLGGGIRLLS